MSRAKRLGKLEQAAAERVRAHDLAAVRIQWVTPDGVAEIPPSSSRPPAMTISLTRSDDAPVPAPEWLDHDTPTVPTERPALRGQRPRQPTEDERAAAIETLRERARRGTFAGELPPSAEEIRADQARREALQRDAALIRRMGRPVAAAPLSRRV